MTLDQILAHAAEHARQIESGQWLGVKDLVARWGMSGGTIRKIPRDHLPYLEFGDTKIRRYAPSDVQAFEDTMKRGAA